MCRPFGPSLALPRIIQGTVTLLIHDPIRALLSRHVITVKQGDQPMIECELHSTATQMVTKDTVHSTTRVVFKGMGRVLLLTQLTPPGDLDLINLSTLEVLINSHHVTNRSSSKGNSLIEVKDRQREMIAATPIRFPIIATDRTKLEDRSIVIPPQFSFHTSFPRSTVFRFGEQRLIHVARMNLITITNVLIKLSFRFKCVK